MLSLLATTAWEGAGERKRQVWLQQRLGQKYVNRCHFSNWDVKGFSVLKVEFTCKTETAFQLQRNTEKIILTKENNTKSSLPILVFYNRQNNYWISPDATTAFIHNVGLNQLLQYMFFLNFKHYYINTQMETLQISVFCTECSQPSCVIHTIKLKCPIY